MLIDWECPECHNTNRDIIYGVGSHLHRCSTCDMSCQITVMMEVRTLQYGRSEGM